MKRLIKTKSVLGIAIAFVLCAASIISTPAFADDASKDRKIFIQVSPGSQKVSLEPGSTYEGSYRLANIGTEAFTAKIYASPFYAADDKYGDDFATINTYNQMHSWITFSQDTVHLDAGEGIEMHYTIDVPQDVPNGGQYAAIMAETEEASGSSSALKANSRVAMKVYARIAGETRESGNIIENNVPGIVFGGNLVTTTSLVENTGNVHQEAKYIMRVFPFGSGEEVYTNEEDPTKATILPETKRYYSLTWEQTPQLGLYTVEQVVEFAGQTSTTSKLVVICPIWLLIIFIALILAIIFTIVTRARSRKQERRESSASRSHHSSEKHEKSEDKE